MLYGEPESGHDRGCTQSEDGVGDHGPGGVNDERQGEVEDRAGPGLRFARLPFDQHVEQQSRSKGRDDGGEPRAEFANAEQFEAPRRRPERQGGLRRKGISSVYQSVIQFG